MKIDIGKLFRMNNKILIIGLPRAGKTYLFESIRDHIYMANSDYEIFLLQTDDYKKEPWVTQIYTIMDKLRGEEKWLVEGVQGYRILRKYAQLHDEEIKPDLIIVVSCSEPPLKKHRGMVKTMTKIWKDYVDIEIDLPTILHYHRTTGD